MGHSDICIAGAGIIGLSLALELHRRGATVAIYEHGTPLAQASTAAAGMLAAADPENPPALRPLADLSLSLYPAYLAYIESLSGIAVPFQTTTTLQAVEPDRTPANPGTLALLPQLVPGKQKFLRLEEHSLDPRQLAHALLAAVQAAKIPLHSNTPVLKVRSHNNGVEFSTSAGVVNATRFIDCTGAWAGISAELSSSAISPSKGQMLTVALPPSLPLNLVVRTPEIYIVPRTLGPNAGRAIIGATIEDKGFDTTVYGEDIARLHAQAAALLPQLASATVLESWAGLRPATTDGLPVLGALPHRPNHLIAAGHYRNGILLAPATAKVMADLLTASTPPLDLTRFSPARFATTP
jgi:glycine oxidase